MENNTLQHYGVLGMKWGVRRKRKAAAHDDYSRAHSGKSVRSMSDKELRDTNNRLQMERQYQTLTQKTSIGKKAVKAFIGTAGTIVAAEAAYKTYKRLGDGAIDKIGDMVMKSIDLTKPLA